MLAFKTQSKFNQKKPKASFNQKIKVPWDNLQHFYNQLIQQLGRPELQKFLTFNNKLDIQKKFPKYSEQIQKQLKIKHISQDNYQNIAFHHLLQNSHQDVQFDDQNEQQLQTQIYQNDDYFENINKEIQNIDEQVRKKQQKFILLRPQNLEKQFKSNQQIAKDFIRNNSCISYFHIDQDLKQLLISSYSKKKSNQDKKQEKQTLQRLNQFLYNEQSLFYIIKGSAQLQKYVQSQDDNTNNKLEQTNNNKNQQSLKNSYEESNVLTMHKSQQMIFSKYSSKQQLKSKYENKQKSAERVYKGKYRKVQQIKDNEFFSLINYKSLGISPEDEPQKYKLIPKTQFLLAKICINPSYGIKLLRRNYKKIEMISQLFFGSNKSQFKKHPNKKQIFTAFQVEVFKRDMSLSFQGRQNNKIYILANQAQLEMNKAVYYKQNQNIGGWKNIKICNIKGKCIINGQKYLKNSKKIKHVIDSHRLFQSDQSLRHQNFSNENKNSEELLQKRNKKKQTTNNSTNKNQFNNALFIGKQEKKGNSSNKQRFDEQLAPIQKNKKIRPKLSDQKKQSGQRKNPRNVNQIQSFQQNKLNFICLGQNQNAYMRYYNKYEHNLSNFTIKTQSAFVQLYSIETKKFQKCLTQKMKDRFIKKYEDIYLAYLRRSIEKLNNFSKLNQQRASIKNKQLQEYAAMAEAQRQRQKQENRKKIQMPLTKLQFHNKNEFNGLKRNSLAFKDGQLLEKRVQIIKTMNQQNNNRQNSTVNIFKSKIQNLIIKNLHEINSQINHPHKINASNALNQYYTENISHIFIKDDHRSQAIRIKDQPFNIKQNRLKKKYQSTPSNANNRENQIFIDPDFFDPVKNKIFKINLLKKGHPSVIQNLTNLKGINIQQYTDTIKNNLQMRINQTNKIKEQSMKIESKCQSCRCYDDLQSYKNLGHYHNHTKRPNTQQYRNSSADVKYHTMKIGVHWRSKHSSMSNYQKQQQKAKNLHNPKNMEKKLNEMADEDEPFERVYNRIKVLKQKSLQKFKFNQHLLRKSISLKSRKQRKKSAPLLIF